MAIYSFEITPYSRSRGESMPLKAAYRSGTEVYDRRLGRTADYRRRRGVELEFMAFPHGLSIGRETIWNAVEAREARRDACVGRQAMYAFPFEISAKGRERCARRFADYLIEEHGVFVDCAIHLPNPQGDQRNRHAHVLFPTRKIDRDGNLTTKTREWDDLTTGPEVVRKARAIWADIANEELALEGHADVRIDPRSNADRGIVEKPGKKLGLRAIAIERRTGKPSSKRLHISQPIEINESLVAAVRSYMAERDGAAPKQPHNEREPAPIDIDVGAVLAALRYRAARQTARDLEAKVRARKAADAPEPRPSRKRQSAASPTPAARGRAGSRRRVRKTLAPSSPARQANRPLCIQAPPVVQLPKTEHLSVDERTKIWGVAIAAAGLTMTNSAAEVASFIERSCEFVAGQLGLPAAMIKSRAERYRSLGRTQIESVLPSVFEQFRRLIDTLQDRYDVVRRGKDPRRRPLDTMGHAQAAVANAILGAVEIVDRLLADKRLSRTTPSIDATLGKEGDHEQGPKSDAFKPTPAATRDHSKKEDAGVHGAAAKTQAPALRDVPPVGVATFENRHRQGSDETVALSFEPLHQSTSPRKQTPDKALDSVRKTTAPQPEPAEKPDLASLADDLSDERPSTSRAYKGPLDAPLPTTASADGASQRSEKAPPDGNGPQSMQGGIAAVPGSTTGTVEACETTPKLGADRTGKKEPRAPATRRGKDDWGR